ncbi:hypothetical protein VP01_872g2 [Puccinia sorghi]|uniref:Uncharacterized protein n=1 Tax=Puccinia sorghi TaxID=27349 RepID=A0A0L6U8M3_9BASI|nr:hypothetical protein VP01_872g2 [Puccinia sorghi]
MKAWNLLSTHMFIQWFRRRFDGRSTLEVNLVRQTLRDGLPLKDGLRPAHTGQPVIYSHGFGRRLHLMISPEKHWAPAERITLKRREDAFPQMLITKHSFLAVSISRRMAMASAQAHEWRSLANRMHEFASRLLFLTQDIASPHHPETQPKMMHRTSVSCIFSIFPLICGLGMKGSACKTGRSRIPPHECPFLLQRRRRRCTTKRTRRDDGRSRCPYLDICTLEVHTDAMHWLQLGSGITGLISDVCLPLLGTLTSQLNPYKKEGSFCVSYIFFSCSFPERKMRHWIPSQQLKHSALLPLVHTALLQKLIPVWRKVMEPRRRDASKQHALVFIKGHSGSSVWWWWLQFFDSVHDLVIAEHLAARLLFVLCILLLQWLFYLAVAVVLLVLAVRLMSFFCAHKKVLSISSQLLHPHRKFRAIENPTIYYISC